MLHTPTSETKNHTAFGKAQKTSQPERVMSNTPIHGATGLCSAGGNTVPGLSAGMQQRQTLARMQATHGNQAVLRTLHSPQQLARMPILRPSQSIRLQRKCACGGSSEMEGECEECKAKGEGTLQRRVATPTVYPAAGVIQTKLAINQPGDEYEQEADRVSEQVMTTPTHHSVSGALPRIQRFSGQSNGQMDTAPASVDQALARPGRPLESGLRQDMEQRFGYDFSRVRVHSGATAEQSARDVNAHAYTVGHNMVFGAGRFAPGTQEGGRLLAHELTHVVQQSGANGIRVDKTNAGRGLSLAASEKEAGKVEDVITDTEKLDHGSKHLLSMQQSVRFGTLQRTPVAPVTGGNKVPFDRSKVDITAIRDVRLDIDLEQLMAIVRPAFVQFIDPSIKSYSTTLYDPADGVFSTSANSPIPGGRLAAFPLFENPITALTQGRYILRCIGYDAASQPVAYADRSFYVWTSTPTGKPPDIAALEAEKTSLEATTKVGSGKKFDEVAIAFTKLQDVTQRLGILETGTGHFVGDICPVQPPGTKTFNCTNIVLLVLENVFTQQGHGADWAKVKKKQEEHTKSRPKVKGKEPGVEGEDIQAALQSEAGWKGIFWAPDPQYKIPDEELVGHPPYGGITGEEAADAFRKAKNKGIYKEPGEPSVSIEHLVTNYAPEAPNEPRKAGYPGPSRTKKDTTQLDKLKKLPFGVLSAHGAYHMTLIIYGKVVEVHWDKEATDVDLIQQTDLEKWAVGSVSGYHYFASGVIVAPAADVDAAFK